MPSPVLEVRRLAGAQARMSAALESFSRYVPRDVIAELSGRAGTIKSMEMLDSGAQRIEGNVPLARMFGYSTSLRSSTQGRGTFSMQFAKFDKAN